VSLNLRFRELFTFGTSADSASLTCRLGSYKNFVEIIVSFGKGDVGGVYLSKKNQKKEEREGIKENPKPLKIHNKETRAERREWDGGSKESPKPIQHQETKRLKGAQGEHHRQKERKRVR